MNGESGSEDSKEFFSNFYCRYQQSPPGDATKKPDKLSTAATIVYFKYNYMVMREYMHFLCIHFINALEGKAK